MKELILGKKKVPVVIHNDFTCPFCGSENTSKIGSKDKALHSYMLLHSSFTTIGAAAILKQKKFLDKNNVDIVQCNRCAESYFMERKIVEDFRSQDKEISTDKIKKTRKVILIAFAIYVAIFVFFGLLTNI